MNLCIKLLHGTGRSTWYRQHDTCDITPAQLLTCALQEKRSAYAPTEEEPVRYDGIYRIARCWRKAGMQKFLVCRYLFVRCDNEPAPWSTEGGPFALT